MNRRHLLLVFLFCIQIVCKAQLFSNEVRFHWHGAVTANSFVVKASITSICPDTYLWIDEDSLFSTPKIYGPFVTDTNTRLMANLKADSLAEGTTYYYAVACGATPDLSAEDIGKVKTFVTGPQSFSFVFASCSVNNGHRAYAVIDSLNPDFFMNIGDLHYLNPNSLDLNVHRNCYETSCFNKNNFVNLVRDHSFAYMWDDHDFCGDGSDSLRIGRANARRAYQEYVPHYPLARGSGNVAVYQSFIIGRIKFILCDLRSDRGLLSILGTQQFVWLKNEMRHARDNNLIVAWISPDSFGGASPADNWGSYTNEREILSNFFRDDTIKNMFILSGDAHMLAIDNGIMNDWSTGSNNPFNYPIFQSAALNAWGSYKGGYYSEGGYFINPDTSYGQFGLVNVYDSGTDSVCIYFRGFRVNNFSSTQLLNEYYFCKTPGNYILGSEILKQEVEDFEIFPNPSTGILLIKSATAVKEISVYSVLGNLLIQDHKMNNKSIDLSLLTNGVYMIKVKLKDKTVVKKIILSNQ